MKKTIYSVLFAAALLGTGLEKAVAQAPFTYGNLVVYRVGNGSAALSSSSTVVFIDEYTPAGALVQSIAMPTAASGANAPLTASGSATSEGLLSLSADGLHLVLTGYAAVPGTASIAGTTSATVPRVAGVLDVNANINTSTALTDYSTGNSPRSVTSTDGINIWVTGAVGGIRYATLGSTTSTQVSTTLTNIRQTNIFGGQIYVTTSSGTAVRLGTVGTGTPTTAGQTITNLPGIPATSGSPYGFFFADLSNTVPGVDVVYVADDTPGSIQKYSLVSGTWVSNGSTTLTGVRGLTGSLSGSTITLYGTSSGTISKVVDLNGYNGSFSPTVAPLATAGTNTAFRGIAFAPAVCNSPSISAVTSNAPVCANQALTFGVSATGDAPLTYSWTGAGSFSSTSVSSPTVTGGSTGNYSVTVSNGCGSASSTISVTVNPVPSASLASSTNISCHGAGDGSATVNALGGTPGYTYSWAPGGGTSATATGLSGNTYTCTVTDNAGCSATQTVSISEPAAITSSQSFSICPGGSVTVGTSTYTTAGTYTDVVTAMNGCDSTITTTLTVYSLPGVTANTSAAAVCAGGSVTLTGGGATTYTWTGGVTNGVSFAPASTQTYTVTGTDAHSCVNTATVSVDVNPLPTIVANATALTVCAGDNVTLNGAGALSYTWTGGVTDNIPFAISATQTFTVSGSDVNNCVGTDAITINVNTLPVVTANTSSATVCAGDNVTLTGGGANTYTWTGGVTDGNAFVPSATQTYTVTGTDGNNCKNTATVTVNVNTLPAVTANTSAAAVCTGDNVTLTGGGAATYTWTGGVTDGVAFAASSSQTYTVTGTDGNNCMNTATVTVNVNMLPAVTANTSSTSVCAGDNVTLTGGGATTYTWTGGITDGTAFTPASSQVYTVTGTDGNGCINTATVSVAVNSLPTIIATATSATVCINDADTLNATGGVAYMWSSNAGSASTSTVVITATATDTYTVTGADFNGCVNTATVTVTVNNCSMSIKQAQALEVSVYPSPGNGILTIAGQGEINYTVFNSLGQVVKAGNTKTGNTVNLQDQQNGLYYITLTQNGKTAKAKVIIEK